MSAQEQHPRPNPKPGLNSATADRAGANWSRGFFRLWLVTAVVWLLLVVLLSRPWGSVDVLLKAHAENAAIAAENAARRAEGSKTFQLTAEQMDAVLGEVPIDTRTKLAQRAYAWERLRGILWLALLPPLAVLALGASVGWALRGFRREGR